MYSYIYIYFRKPANAHIPILLVYIYIYMYMYIYIFMCFFNKYTYTYSICIYIYIYIYVCMYIITRYIHIYDTHTILHIITDRSQWIEINTSKKLHLKTLKISKAHIIIVLNYFFNPLLHHIPSLKTLAGGS